MLTKERLNSIFQDFNNKNIIILGDVMLDAYVWGKVERISPEAPVPIVAVNKRENRLGGAANVALNIKALGATPVMCSVIGNDQKGTEFIELVEKEEMPVDGLIQSKNRITTTKFRVLGNNSQLLRVDEEDTKELSSEDEETLFSTIQKIIEEKTINAIIFQDYNKGVLTTSIIEKVIELANNKNIPCITDPKKLNFLAYKNIKLFKPNLKELKEGLNLDTDLSNKDNLFSAAKMLHNKMNLDIVLTTLSEKGVFISWKQNNDYTYQIFSAHRRSISDVSGAGDTVVSVASLCLSCNMELQDLARIANLAGGIVCEEVGVVPVNKERLLQESLNLFTNE